HLNKAIALLARGDFAGGWDLFEWRWKIGILRRDHHRFRQPLWQGRESLFGRTILLHSEQGFGDTMQFVRYAPLLAQRGARVLLLAQPPLTRLLSGLDGVTAVYTEGEVPPGFDYHCPLMSLPRAFGTQLATIPAAIPYLHAEPRCAVRWRERLGAG